MEIPATEVQKLHELLMPIFLGEIKEYTDEEKIKLLSEYEKDMIRQQEDFSRESRVNIMGNYISLLTDLEREILEDRANISDAESVREELTFPYYDMMGKEFNMPEEYVIFMLSILRAAIFFTNILEEQEDTDILFDMSISPEEMLKKLDQRALERKQRRNLKYNASK